MGCQGGVSQNKYIYHARNFQHATNEFCPILFLQKISNFLFYPDHQKILALIFTLWKGKMHPISFSLRSSELRRTERKWGHFIIKVGNIGTIGDNFSLWNNHDFNFLACTVDHKKRPQLNTRVYLRVIVTCRSFERPTLLWSFSFVLSSPNVHIFLTLLARVKICQTSDGQ